MAGNKYAEYQNEYQKEFQRTIRLKINRKTESDLLDWLLGKDNMQGYIKHLIRKDMEEEGKK